MNYIHNFATTTTISKNFHHPKQNHSSISFLISYPEFYKVFSHFYLGNVCFLSLSFCLSLHLPICVCVCVCVCVFAHTRAFANASNSLNSYHRKEAIGCSIPISSITNTEPFSKKLISFLCCYLSV